MAQLPIGTTPKLGTPNKLKTRLADIVAGETPSFSGTPEQANARYNLNLGSAFDKKVSQPTVSQVIDSHRQTPTVAEVIRKNTQQPVFEGSGKGNGIEYLNKLHSQQSSQATAPAATPIVPMTPTYQAPVITAPNTAAGITPTYQAPKVGYTQENIDKTFQPVQDVIGQTQAENQSLVNAYGQVGTPDYQKEYQQLSTEKGLGDIQKAQLQNIENIQGQENIVKGLGKAYLGAENQSMIGTITGKNAAQLTQNQAVFNDALDSYNQNQVYLNQKESQILGDIDRLMSYREKTVTRKKDDIVNQIKLNTALTEPQKDFLMKKAEAKTNSILMQDQRAAEEAKYKYQAQKERKDYAMQQDQINYNRQLKQAELDLQAKQLNEQSKLSGQAAQLNDLKIQQAKKELTAETGKDFQIISSKNADGSESVVAVNKKDPNERIDITSKVETTAVKSPEEAKSSATFDPSFKPDFEKYNTGKLGAAEKKLLASQFGGESNFVKQAEDYGKKVSAESLPTTDAYIKDLEYLRDNVSYPNLIAKETGKGDFASVYNSVTSKGALNNLIDSKARGATFGALSDAELKMLQASSDAGKLGALINPESFKKNLDEMIVNAKRIRNNITKDNPYIESVQPSSKDSLGILNTNTSNKTDSLGILK